uniref:Uncharacterized protein n=1 Tax=Rhizophora mucronata TaxID=61149 RepID=A0A2P2M1B9_RHIMU
MFELKLLPE